jgi:hypothetical protein
MVAKINTDAVYVGETKTLTFTWRHPTTNALLDISDIIIYMVSPTGVQTTPTVTPVSTGICSVTPTFLRHGRYTFDGYSAVLGNRELGYVEVSATVNDATYQ